MTDATQGPYSGVLPFLERWPGDNRFYAWYRLSLSTPVVKCGHAHTTRDIAEGCRVQLARRFAVR